MPLDADGNAILGPGAPQPVVSAAPASMTMQTPAPVGTQPLDLRLDVRGERPERRAGIVASDLRNAAVPLSGGTTLSKSVPLALYIPWVYAASYARQASPPIKVTDEFGNAQSVGGTFPNYPLRTALHTTRTTAGSTSKTLVRRRISPYTIFKVTSKQVAGTFPNTRTPTSLPESLSKPIRRFTLRDVPDRRLGGSVRQSKATSKTVSQGFVLRAKLSDRRHVLSNQPRDLYYKRRRRKLLAFDEQGNQLILSGTFPNTSSPYGIAYDPRNTLLYITNNANPGLTVYDTQGNQVSVTGSFSGLSQPIPVVYDPHSDWFYVGDCDGVTPIQVFLPNGNTQTMPNAFATTVAGLAVVP